MSFVERDTEIAALRRTVAEGAAGLSSAAVVEGVAGSGKTTLIRFVAEEALVDGMVVVRPAKGANPGWVRLGDGGWVDVSVESVVALAGRGLVICLDNVHAVGLREVQRIQQMVGAVRPHGTALLVARNPARDRQRTYLDSFLLRLTNFRRIHIGGLSRLAVTLMISRHLDAEPRDLPELGREFHAVTGGSPLLLRALVQERLYPTGKLSSVAVPHGLFTQAALACIQHSGTEAADTALGLAVLSPGAEADTALLAQLVGLAPGTVEHCVRILDEAGIVEGRSFRTPLVREAVLESADPERRRALHRDAAALLHGRAADPAVIAQHLMAVRRLDEPWGVDVLRDAAGQALARNDVHEALRTLGLLSQESPDESLRVAQRVSMAIVTCRLNPSAGEQALRSALGTRSPAPGAKGGGAADREPPLDAGGSQADGIGVSGLGVVDRHTERWWHRVLLNRPRPPEPDGPYPASAGAGTVWLDSEDGVGSETAARVERRLRTTPLTDATLPELLNDIRILEFAEPPHSALPPARRFAKEARRLEAPGWEAMFNMVAAQAALNAGDFAEAADHARNAASGAPPRMDTAFSIGLRATQLLAHTRMGEYEQAALLLAPPVPDWYFESVDSFGFLRARGHHLLATGRTDAALESFLHVGELAAAMGVDRPALFPWRLDAVDVLLCTGDRSRAAALLDEQRRAPGASTRQVHGVTLRLEAQFAEPQDRMHLLRRAIEELRGSNNRYELARATGDLGHAWDAVGEFVNGWIAKRRAWRHARECRALALCEELLPGLDLQDNELARIEQAAFDQLSGSELRVAILAGRGYTNREIATQLSLTVSTVEQHLTRVYRKLDITGRKVLASIYVGVGEPPR